MNMVFDEAIISRAIIEASAEKLLRLTDVDVVIVGAGPAGLTASIYLSKKGIKAVVIERRLSFGGGIGGGGMQLPAIVVQERALDVLKEIGCRFKAYGSTGLYVVDPAEMIAKLATSALDSGTDILLGVTVDDVVFRMEDERPEIVGVVLQWTSAIMAGLHVDPLAIRAKAVIDCTGHDAEVLSIASRKIPQLNITIQGESSMWVSRGEELIVEKTGRVCPGLYIAGMSVAAVYGIPRMGPIFGGMLLSGKRVAELVIEDLKGYAGETITVK
jgi:thiamine thiazole synthase